jgi:hypothetical protein
MENEIGRKESVDGATKSLQEEEKQHSPENRAEKGSNAAQDEESTYVTGLELLGVLGSVTLVGFIMMLDTSIIGTVGRRTASSSDA